MKYSKEEIKKAREKLNDMMTGRYRRWVECLKCGHFFEAYEKEPKCIMCLIKNNTTSN